MADRIQVDGVVEAPRDAEAVRQVGRADKEDVNAIDRGDLRGVLDGAPRLDLDDAKDPAIDRLDLRVALLSETCTTGPESEPACAVGLAPPRCW